MTHPKNPHLQIKRVPEDAEIWEAITDVRRAARSLKFLWQIDPVTHTHDQFHTINEALKELQSTWNMIHADMEAQIKGDT